MALSQITEEVERTGTVTALAEPPAGEVDVRARLKPPKLHHEHKLRIKTLFIVLLMVVCANAGDLLLKRGMLQIGTVRISLPALGRAFLATISNGTIWLGVLFLLGFTVFYMTAVSWADYSYVMPAGAFGYALQTLLAVMILHEAVNSKRWIGVALICVGVLLVGQTKPNTTKNGSAV